MKKKIKCFVCHKEINEEEDYVFMGKTVHKGECLKSMIDEYNAVRNLQIRNKRLCAEIERLNNTINELEKMIKNDLEYACLERENERLKQQLQQKENIIKEVREYIESYNLPEDLGYLGEAPISIRELRDILEILDKGE